MSSENVIAGAIEKLIKLIPLTLLNIRSGTMPCHYYQSVDALSERSIFSNAFCKLLQFLISFCKAFLNLACILLKMITLQDFKSIFEYCSTLCMKGLKSTN